MSMPGSYSTDDSDWIPASEDDDESMDLDSGDGGLEAAEQREMEEESERRRNRSRGDDTETIRLGIDPNTRALYLISGNSQTRITSAFLNRMPDLRAMLSARLGESYLPSADDDDDEDEDDDPWDDTWFGRSTRPSSRPPHIIFPIQQEPTEAGMQLERCGEFGRTSGHYNAQNRKLQLYSSNISDRLRRREGRWQKPVKVELEETCIPNSVGTEVCRYNANVYCGQYSDDGSFYYTCGQDFKIRIYDTSEPPSSALLYDPKSTTDRSSTIEETPIPRQRYTRFGHSSYSSRDESALKVIKTVQGHDAYSRWTITDANLSPANDALIYSSIGPVVNFVRTEKGQALESMSTDASDHVQLNFAGGNRRDFGIWSIRFSGDAREIVAGTNAASIFVYDIEQQKSVLRVEAHDDDINAVCFADSASSNVLVSGSDDFSIKVWDRRSMRGRTPSGVLVGHTEGITFVAPKGDGRYVVSNGKDQTAKLWDLRKMYSAEESLRLDTDVNVRGWDYRRGLYKKPRHAKHPQDCSVMTYTGHSVLQTLIRCHFSPISTTGQRYIYSGSADGRIHIWNLDGRINTILDRRDVLPLNKNPYTAPASQRPAQPTPNPDGGVRTTVRDVSWHPTRPELMSVSWDSRMGTAGSCVLHTWRG